MRERLLYLDWLRVVATFMVVTIHVSAGIVGIDYNDSPTNWLAANFYESLSRSAVPLFVMISGALLLGDQREMSYTHFLSKRVSKIFIPLVSWSIIYYIYQVIDHWYPTFSIKQLISLFLTNGISVHFWFMYMILGIYLTTPIVKIFIQHAKRRDIEYFLILWFYASFIVKYMNDAFGFSFNIELFYVTNYVGYFVLGYYLAHYPLKKISGKLALFSTLLGMVIIFFLTFSTTKNAGGTLQEYWYEYHSPGVLLSAIGMFLLFKQYFSKKNLGPLSNAINRLSFGIYLVHMLVLLIFSHRIIRPLQDHFHPILSIPITVLFVLAISGIMTYVISKIPFVKKLIP